MFSYNDVFEHISKSILSGKGIASVEAVNEALELGISIDEIIMDGILKAWSDFCIWYDEDPKESLKAWLDCFNSTQKILQLLDTKIGPSKEPPFSVLVVTVLGEGHILMRDIIKTMLRAKGLKVYTSKRGVRIDDVSEALSDPTLNFVVLSCIESPTEAKLFAFVEGVREQRRDVKIIAGGPLAGKSGADLILDDLGSLKSSIFGYSE